jgi:hypothetical protein
MQRQLKSAFFKAEQHEYDGGRGLTPVCSLHCWLKTLFGHAA